MTATLFDFNGVLVDDEHVHLAGFREVLAPLGIQLTDAAYEERYLGFDDVGAFRAILTDAGHPPTDADVRLLVEAKKPVYFAQISKNLKVFPGAVALVRRRATQGIVGIVSGALRDEIHYCLARMGLQDAIAFIVAAEDTQACKPNPEGYLLGRAALAERTTGPGAAAGVSAADAVVVEDSAAGVRAAKAAGLRCVAVTHSFPETVLRAAGADAVVSSLAELTDEVFDGAMR